MPPIDYLTIYTDIPIRPVRRNREIKMTKVVYTIVSGDDSSKPERLLTIREVSAWLNIGESTLLKLRKSLILPAVPFLKRVMYDPAVVRAYIATFYPDYLRTGEDRPVAESQVTPGLGSPGVPPAPPCGPSRPEAPLRQRLRRNEVSLG